MKLGAAIDHVLKRVDELDIARQPECYSVSEAVYILAGKKQAGLKAMRTPDSHWFLQGPRGEIIDLTAGQFDGPRDYSSAKGAAFYPNTSNLAKELMK